MGSRRKLMALALACAALGCAVLGCEKEEPLTTLLPAGVKPTAPDTAKSGELAEGQLEAFGLILPRDMQMVAQMHNANFAKGRLPFEAASNYVRQRVLAKRIDTGASKTVFFEAVIKRDPKRIVEIEVRKRGGWTEIVVRDRTRKPAEKGLSEAQRWKRAGMTPDGRGADKKAE